MLQARLVSLWGCNCGRHEWSICYNSTVSLLCICPLGSRPPGRNWEARRLSLLSICTKEGKLENSRRNHGWLFALEENLLVMWLKTNKHFLQMIFHLGVVKQRLEISLFILRLRYSNVLHIIQSHSNNQYTGPLLVYGGLISNSACQIVFPSCRLQGPRPVLISFKVEIKYLQRCQKGSHDSQQVPAYCTATS